MLYLSHVKEFDRSNTWNDSCCMTFDIEPKDVEMKAAEDGLMNVFINTENEKATIMIKCKSATFGENPPFWW